VEIVAIILFSIVILVQSIWSLIKAFRIRNYKSRSSDAEFGISVVVCAHNEYENLRELLPILANQSHRDYEVILVLDRCTDGSSKLANQFPDVRTVQIEKVSDLSDPKKNALKEGIAIARKELILLTDADCRPDHGWIQGMSKYGNDQLVLGISPYSKKSGLLNQLIQYETFQTAQEFTSMSAVGETYMGLGRNMAFSKDEFDRVNGFSGIENVIGGTDDLLVQKMVPKAKVALSLESTTHVESLPKTNWRDYISQKTRHYGVAKLYPRKIKIREGLRWALNVLFWIFFTLSVIIYPIQAFVLLGMAFVLRIISINIVADRLGKRFNHLYLPLVDLLYSIFLPLVGLRSRLVKNIKWTN